jgi:hypothetical protein
MLAEKLPMIRKSLQAYLHVRVINTPPVWGSHGVIRWDTQSAIQPPSHAHSDTRCVLKLGMEEAREALARNSDPEIDIWINL